MADSKKRERLLARSPRGFADRSSADIRATERMLATIRGVYERYGFEPVETPFVEYTEALGKFLPDQDRPNEGVFSFPDDDGEWLSLRYDLTAPLARYVAENFDALPKPYRSYRAGWVFRNEKPGPGRFRQFMQFDADTVGAGSPAADAEMCMMMADVMEALGIPRGQYVVKVNNRKVLDGVMEAIGLAGEENAGARLKVLRAIDKLDRVGIKGVEQLLGDGRRDESGDFTKGAGLSVKQIQSIRNLIISPVVQTETKSTFSDDMHGEYLPVDWGDGEIYAYKPDNLATISYLRHMLEKNDTITSGLDDLRKIAELTASAGYPSARILLSPSVVRGLEYYTGPVYEAELTFEVPNEKGEPVVFGSVGGGGRYDGLVGRFRHEDVPATGFSIGVSRLAAALRLTGRLGREEATGPVVVTVMDRDRLPDYQRLAAKLREGLKDLGVGAEMYLGSGGLKAQLKYADRRDSPCAVIQGSDERARGVVQIKDLALGKELSREVADHAAWTAERPAQFEVREDELVERVRDLLRTPAI